MTREVRRRAAVVSADPQLRAGVERLLEENNRLRLALAEVARVASRSAAEALPALTKEEQLRDAIRASDARIGRAFLPGALSAAASLSAAELTVAKSAISVALRETLTRARATASLEGVLPGRATPEAHVRLGWEPDFTPLLRALSQYLHLEVPSEHRPYLQLSQLKNTGGERKTPLSPAIYEYLADHEVYLELQIGASSARVPVLFTGADFATQRHCEFRLTAETTRKDLTSVCLVAQRATSPVLVGLPRGADSNPLVLGITASDASLASSIGLTWVIQVKGEKPIRFPA